jgi:transglutaminase-like putative cysteine protease
MFYSIRHLTKFRYSAPVSESVMELRMCPRSEGEQRCLNFKLTVTPRSRTSSHRDYLGNVVHYFDVPGAHRNLTILAHAMVDVAPRPPLPADLGPGAWERLDREIAAGDFWENLAPSQFARWSDTIDEFGRELDLPLGAARDVDPLALAFDLSDKIHRAISYVPKSTRVDSPVDVALENRQGVCQDYSHIMIALARRMGLPCRYVSGYLFHRTGQRTRSTEGATHAWVEVYLPALGWIGFDPTNRSVAEESHVRTAIGRDYADVPPTRGVFKGGATSELIVAVRVAPSDKAPPPETEIETEDWSAVVPPERPEPEPIAEQQQQQQQ